LVLTTRLFCSLVCTLPGAAPPIGVIDVAQDADDTAFIDDPNLLAEDHGLVG
jgi:hypothetical protein